MSGNRRVLFLMPPFSKHAARRDWDVEEFYNPDGVFERVCIAASNETDTTLPEQIGSLKIFPIPPLKPVKELVTLGPRAYASLDALTRRVREIARDERVDLIVQRYGGPIYHGLPVICAARSLGLPSIVTMQSDYDEVVRLRGNALVYARTRFLRLFQRRLIARHATVVWVVSEFVRKLALQWGVPPERLVLIPNKERVARYRGDHSEEERRKLGERIGVDLTEGGPPFVLSVGRLNNAKNYPTMLEAFARVAPTHPDARYVIIGRGSLEGDLQSVIARLGLEGRVRLVTEHYLNASELSILYRAAQVLLFCSVVEGQGRVAFEAMAAGTPVIGSDIGPIAEIVRHEENGLLVNPRDPHVIARALERFLGGELSKQALRARCLETAQRFDMSVVNPQEAELYRKVIAGAFDRPLPERPRPERVDGSSETAA